MALTNTSPLLAGPGERRLELSGAARWPAPSARSVVIFVHDLAAALMSLLLAFLLRDGGQSTWADVRLLVPAASLFLAVAGPSFLAFGLHRRIWSCTSISDLGAVVKASTWAVLLFVAIGLGADRMTELPRGIWIIQWLILVGLLCGTRLAYRFAKTRARRARAGALRAPAAPDVPVLLYGCDPLASLFVGAVRSAPGSTLRVVGIIDDAGTPRGRYVHDVPVLGAPQELDRILADLAVQGIHPQRLVITRAAEALSPEARLFAEHCRTRHGVELLFLPDLLGLPMGEVASDAARAASSCDRARLRTRPLEASVSALALLVRNAGALIEARFLRRTPRLVPGGASDRLGLQQALAHDGGRQRLLVVNRFFHPDTSATSQLLTDLVDALDGRGFRVTVLAGRHGYLNTGAVLPARAWRAGIEVRRIRHTGFGRFSLPGRTLDGATFAAGAFLALLVRARPGDVILAKTDPPLISVLAWLAARLTGARLVNWCQDLFPETAAALGLRFARGPVGGALRALRNASLRGAATNVALSPGMAARLVAQGMPQERLTVIPNWADGELIRPLAPADNPLRAAWGLAERFVIGYSGNLGCAHAVDPVVELITLLADEPGLAFLFVGAGSGYRPLRAAIAGRRLDNVVFRPYQERAQLPQSLTAPDLHLVTLRPEWEGLVMPSKLYGALAAGRPVLFIGDPEGDVARVLRGGAGLVGSPDRMPALAAQIRTLRRDPARLAQMGAAARRAYDACPREASLAAWTRCLRAAALPAAARPLPQAIAAE